MLSFRHVLGARALRTRVVQENPMHSSRHRCVVAFALACAGFSSCAHAALFCADSVAGLQFALAASEDNGQDDQIDLVAGSYSLNGGLMFLENEAHSLTIFGGYNADCSALVASNTVLSGNSMVPILQVVQQSMSTLASVHIERVTFFEGKTTSSSGGGGLAVYAQNGDVRLESDRFLFNQATTFGGALVVDTNGLITLRNNLFFGNSAMQMGAGELLTTNSIAYVIGNTVVGNSATTASNPIGGLYVASGGSTHFWLANNILWNNNVNAGVDLSTNTAVILLNNDIGTSTFVTPDPLDRNNQSVNPDFAPCSGLACLLAPSFELKRTSPLVDAGENAPPTGTGSFDLAGKPRQIGPHVDIGAFEQDRIFANGFE